MIISQEKKFIFFACGKTGTTSIEKILQPYHDAADLELQIGYDCYLLRKQFNKPYNPKHVLPSMVRKYMTDSEWNSYFKFVFVRNPWDWVIASFCYNFKFLSQFLGKFEKEHFDAIWHLLKLHNQSPENDNYYQHNFVYEKDIQVVDYVGKFESIHSDFTEICTRINVPLQNLPHENKSHHQDYKSLYTPETIEMVKHRYQRDIELFGYEY